MTSNTAQLQALPAHKLCDLYEAACAQSASMYAAEMNTDALEAEIDLIQAELVRRKLA